MKENGTKKKKGIQMIFVNIESLYFEINKVLS